MIQGISLNQGYWDLWVPDLRASTASWTLCFEACSILSRVGGLIGLCGGYRAYKVRRGGYRVYKICRV